MNVVVKIMGRPQPKARPKVERRGAGLHVYTPTSEAENAAAMEMMKHRGKLRQSHAVAVSMIFYGARAQADIDNLGKLYLDALVKADVFGDDRKVHALWLERRALDDEGARTEIIVSEWNGWTED